MKAKEAWAWEFTQELSNSSEVRCPDCKEWSPLAEWNESEVFCEDCGDHAAMQCPKCEERFDHVHGPTFEARDPASSKDGSRSASRAESATKDSENTKE